MPNTGSSQHTQSLRTIFSHIFESAPHSASTLRPLLNLPVLGGLLDGPDIDASGSTETNEKGKKRALNSNASIDRPSKRFKNSQSPVPRHVIEGPTTEVKYPDVHGLQNSNPNATVSVYSHTFDLSYTLDADPDAPRHTLEHRQAAMWEEQEANICDKVSKLTVPNEPRSLDLGRVRIGYYNGRVVACTMDGEWLLLVPQLNPDRRDAKSLDMEESSAEAEDIIYACLTLERHGRVNIDASLTIIVLPVGLYDPDQDEMPFRLQIHIDITPIHLEMCKPPSLGLGMAKPTIRVLLDAQRRLMCYLYPDALDGIQSDAINMQFLYSILQPAPQLLLGVSEAAVQPAQLLPRLLPFQSRSVSWLLNREGATISSDGVVSNKPPSPAFSFWDPIVEGNDTWFLNRLTGELSDSLNEDGSEPLGGMLAEEPGLGKTIETLALILLHPAPLGRNPTITTYDSNAELDVKAIKTSLIVTPPALASQWADEIAAHAPSLKVLVYDGWSKVTVPIEDTPAERARVKRLKAENQKARNKKGKENVPAPSPEVSGVVWADYVHTFDVVITTYTVLRDDFNVARAAPKRPRREDVVYTNLDRPRSPLVMCDWYRVIMDEVQMVGGGHTEGMVSLIPRLSSLAISGTPARSQVADLIHVIKFLRADRAIGNHWKRLLAPGLAPQLAKFLQHYALRTGKASVKDELTIPSQSRYLVPIEMGKVERHVYDQTLETILLDLGLDARGVAASEGWEVDGNLLRNSVRRLRGICTHPQVGQLQKLNDKLFKPGVLKSMEDVLQMMQDQNWRGMMDEWKAKIQLLVKKAQIQQYDQNNRHRYQDALDTLLSVEKEAKSIIAEIDLAIVEQEAKGKLLKDEAKSLKIQGSESQGAFHSNGKGRAVSPTTSDDDSEDGIDEDDIGIPKTPAGDEYKNKRRALQARLRENHVVLHRVKFLLGDVYHVLGISHSVQEDAAYGDAENIRRGLLKVTEDDANKGMGKLVLDGTKQGIDLDSLLIEVPFVEKVDNLKKSAEHIEDLDKIIDVLNQQSTLLWTWRTEMHTLLTQPLNSNGDGADGEEYQRTLDNQGAAEAYLQEYQALLADRREAVHSERTVLAAHQAKEKKSRSARLLVTKPAFLRDEEELPETQVLRREMQLERKGILLSLDGHAIKTIVVALTAIMNGIHRQTDPELVFLKTTTTALRELITAQGSMLKTLEKDLGYFLTAFNAKVTYFRQLQEISDSVTELILENSVEDSLVEVNVELEDSDAKINTSRARQRYLNHLTKDRVSEPDEDDDACILCKYDFQRGFITECAHVFCEGCMKAWLRKREGKCCPVCRVPIDATSMQRFTIRPDKIPASKSTDMKTPKSTRPMAYNMIDPTLYQSIKAIESFGDHGKKIQILMSHLLYLQDNDPGAKSIVFSAWADSLHILARALQENGISYLRIDTGTRAKSATKTFRDDPDILVLLLHGERENAGLNLTAASRVFLVEPVVSHTFEIQAIARIDRMGQKRSTEVYCYYAEDTVEKNILDLATRKNLSLYTKENSAGTINATVFTSEQDKQIVDGSTKKKDQKGDFISKIDDLLAALFPHLYEDVEYLVPPDEDVEMHDAMTSALAPLHINAEAGPSQSRQ